MTICDECYGSFLSDFKIGFLCHVNATDLLPGGGEDTAGVVWKSLSPRQYSISPLQYICNSNKHFTVVFLGCIWYLRYLENIERTAVKGRKIYSLLIFCQAFPSQFGEIERKFRYPAYFNWRHEYNFTKVMHNSVLEMEIVHLTKENEQVCGNRDTVLEQPLQTTITASLSSV